MDFVSSKFGTNEPLPVEHFFPHFLSGLLCVRSLYQSYFLQNPYFRSTSRLLKHSVFVKEKK